MPESSVPGFMHRHNQDNTWDSICMKCFLTIANSGKQHDLREAEIAHDCAGLWKVRTTHFE